MQEIAKSGRSCSPTPATDTATEEEEEEEEECKEKSGNIGTYSGLWRILIITL